MIVEGQPVTDELTWHDVPTLRRAVLVAAFTGWFDIAGGATAAVAHLGGDVRTGCWPPSIRTASSTSRPGDRRCRSTRTAGGCCRGRATRSGAADGEGPVPGGVVHDLVLLSGEEPNLRWSTFAGLVVEVVRRLGCEMVVTVGTVADTHPHTRSPLVFGSSTNEALASRLGLSRPRYEGPTGVVGVLHDRLDRAGVPAISLRAPVPHYLAGSPNPKSTVALLQHLEHVLGVPTGHGALAAEVAEWDRRHQEAVDADDDAPGYVRQLELVHDQRVDAAVGSGDDLAAELEAFLREQRDEPG